MHRLAPLAALALAALGLAAPAPALADGEPEGHAARGVDKGALGVGLILGEPTGLSARLYLADDQAVQAAVGFAFAGGGPQAHVDYVFHPFIFEEREAFTLPFYVGPGVRLIDHARGRGGDSDFAVGARAVAGLLFDFKAVPLDAFAEVAAVLEYRFGGAGAGASLNAGAGVRYYF